MGITYVAFKEHTILLRESRDSKEVTEQLWIKGKHDDTDRDVCRPSNRLGVQSHGLHEAHLVLGADSLDDFGLVGIGAIVSAIMSAIMGSVRLKRRLLIVRSVERHLVKCKNQVKTFGSFCGGGVMAKKN